MGDSTEGSDVDLGHIRSALLSSVRSVQDGGAGYDVESEAFVEFMMKRIAAGEVTPTGVADLQIRDLVLVFACLSGKKNAIEALDELCRQQVDRVARKFRNMKVDRDDLMQMVRARLLVDTPERRARLAEYQGHGSLNGWLRTMVARMVINLNAESRAKPEFVAADEFMEVVTSGGADAEMMHVRRHCEGALKEALQESAHVLQNRERTLLRYLYTDGRSMEEVALVYSVHRTTVSRWIQVARSKLLKGVRHALAEKLDMSDDTAASLLRVALSRVDMTLSRLLGG